LNKEIKEKIVEISRIMYQKSMVNAYEGNVSVREDDIVYITPTQVCKGYLAEDMISVTDMQGNLLEGRPASSEIKLHLEIYRLRPDVKSVIHNHSPFATAYAIANKPIETKAYPEMIIAFDRIPVVDYGTPSTSEIYNGIERYIYDTDVLLLANHGIVSSGKDVYDAFFKIEAVENIAKTLTITRLIGGEKPIPEDKIEELYKIRMQNFGRNKISGK
jgi:L-fuculose-phosphate aldolase